MCIGDLVTVVNKITETDAYLMGQTFKVIFVAPSGVLIDLMDEWGDYIALDNREFAMSKVE